MINQGENLDNDNTYGIKMNGKSPLLSSFPRPIPRHTGRREKIRPESGRGQRSGEHAQAGRAGRGVWRRGSEGVDLGGWWTGSVYQGPRQEFLQSAPGLRLLPLPLRTATRSNFQKMCTNEKYTERHSYQISRISPKIKSELLFFRSSIAQLKYLTDIYKNRLAYHQDSEDEEKVPYYLTEDIQKEIIQILESFVYFILPEYNTDQEGSDAVEADGIPPTMR